MPPSLTNRFLLSFGANLSRALLSFATGLLIARGLGPDEYGTMMFLLGTFVATRQLLDMGSSTAFFTFLSQQQRSRRFVGWFSVWMWLQFLLPLLAVAILFPGQWIELIWRGEQRFLVVLAFMAAYSQSTLWPVMMQIGESQRLTYRVQSLNVIAASAHLLVVLLAWWLEWLSTTLILAAMFFEWGVVAWLLARYLKFPDISTGPDSFVLVLKEFRQYCLPLIPYAWLGFVHDFADRWLLQNYGGSIQQAYYAVAFQFGALAGIATASMLNVLWKEIAEAHHQGNRQRVIALYQKTSRTLYFVSASLAGFVLPWAETILRLTVGVEYVSGAGALMVMMLYPLHQSMGQIGGTMLYATGQIRTQVSVGMVFMAVGVVTTYFVLAPPTATFGGLGLGSTGLAGKMVILQLFAVNVIAVLLAKRLGTPWDWQYQLVIALLCIMGGWLSYSMALAVFGEAGHIELIFLMNGLIYTALISVTVWLSPGWIGISKDDICHMITRSRL